MSKIQEFRDILNKYGVTKCYISQDFDFDATEPNGTIYLDIKNSDMNMELYKLFTTDSDGLISDDQSLWISSYDFVKKQPNFSIKR